jgi:Glycosyl transferase family 2
LIDLVFVSWNRLAYTQRSFAALLANTDWASVACLYLADDASTDGTERYLAEACGHVPAGVEVVWLDSPFGGPVAAVNQYLEQATPGVEILGKIDNDTMAPPGWLPELLRLLDVYPEIDLLGMAPDIGPPRPAPFADRTIRLAPWVDGNGLWRHRTFAGRARPVPGHSNGRFGFTEWQGSHPDIVKAWASPDLPVFQLDLLPFEPWLSLAAEYVAAGWQRYWPPHDVAATDYWAWADV